MRPLSPPIDVGLIGLGICVLGQAPLFVLSVLNLTESGFFTVVGGLVTLTGLVVIGVAVIMGIQRWWPRKR